MNANSDAADQVVRITLEGAEFAIRLAGSGAKHIAVMLIAMAKQQHKTRGATRLNSMLRSGKPLKVFTFSAEHMKKFKEVAKDYGILYTILKENDKTGGVFDVLVPADDESKINRIVERFELVKIDTASLKAELLKEKAARDQKTEADNDGNSTLQTAKENDSENGSGQPPPEQYQSAEEYEEGVTNQLFSTNPLQKDEVSVQNPEAARTDESPRQRRSSLVETKRETETDSLSEPTSSDSKREEVLNHSSTHEHGGRESVREKIARIKRERAAAATTAPVKETVHIPKPKSKDR